MLRLQAMKRVTYSTGAVWATLDNLHRSVRFLRENSHLVITLPGPHEPTTEQLNKVMIFLMDEIRDLEKGVSLVCPLALTCSMLLPGEDFDVHGLAEPQTVHATIPLNVSDSPARIKLGGFMSQSAAEFMCYVCEAPFASLTDHHCFEPGRAL
jgi:hypothetical protein